MEEKYLFRKLLDEYPDMEEVLKSWFISYFDDNHPEHYLPCNSHLLHPQPTIEIRDWEIIVKSGKLLKPVIHVHADWASRIMESTIFDIAKLSISYKPIQIPEMFPRHMSGKVEWEIYKGTEKILKGIDGYNSFQDLSAAIFFPIAFEIISQELKKQEV